MNRFQQAQRAWRVQYFLKEIELSGGNVSAAAAHTGVHRNTIMREMKAAGYDSAALVKKCGLKRMQHRLNPTPSKKPPEGETPAKIEHLMAYAKRLG